MENGENTKKDLLKRFEYRDNKCECGTCEHKCFCFGHLCDFYRPYDYYEFETTYDDAYDDRDVDAKKAEFRREWFLYENELET